MGLESRFCGKDSIPFSVKHMILYQLNLFGFFAWILDIEYLNKKQSQNFTRHESIYKLINDRYYGFFELFVFYVQHISRLL